LGATLRGEHAPEHRRHEQVAVAHHRGAERLGLQARQPGGGVGGVEGVVGLLEEV
jgi:hypothetical protein